MKQKPTPSTARETMQAIEDIDPIDFDYDDELPIEFIEAIDLD
jgi:hypothetical protein